MRAIILLLVLATLLVAILAIAGDAGGRWRSLWRSLASLVGAKGREEVISLVEGKLVLSPLVHPTSSMRSHASMLLL